MEYKEYIKCILTTFKGVNFKIGVTIPIKENDKMHGWLSPVQDDDFASYIMEWREENPIGFANRFEGTIEKTKNWINNILLPREDRILFYIFDYTYCAAPMGHIGFSSFDFEKKTAEIDNVVRGRKKDGFLKEEFHKGLMSLATKTLINWGKQSLGLQDIYLKVLSDNPHAVTFYERLGFKEQNRIPLFKVEKENMIEWLPLEDTGKRYPDKYFIVMKLCQ